MQRVIVREGIHSHTSGTGSVPGSNTFKSSQRCLKGCSPTQRWCNGHRTALGPRHPPRLGCPARGTRLGRAPFSSLPRLRHSHSPGQRRQANELQPLARSLPHPAHALPRKSEITGGKAPLLPPRGTTFPVRPRGTAQRVRRRALDVRGGVSSSRTLLW